MNNNPPIVRIALASVAGIVLLVSLSFGGCAATKSFSRYQKRADANNAVKVTNINIRKAQQQARIVAAQDATIKARADQRVIEARGIREAQDIISKTLNPYYLTHEAIKAQQAIATSGRNNTVIYVPSGMAGTPTLTQDITGSRLTQTPQGGQ